MPRRKTKSRKKKTKRRMHNTLSIKPSKLGLFGRPSVRKKLRYAVVSKMGVAPGGFNIVQFRCNSVFDPEQITGGGQPRWHDQIQPFFNHYCVLGSKITVQIAHDFPGTVSPAIVGLAVRPTIVTESAPRAYMENGECAYRLFNNENPQTITLKKSFNTARYFGKKKPQDAYELKGTATSNPAEQAFYHLFLQNLDPLASDQYCVTVTMEYDVIYSEPIPAPAS